MSKHNTKLYSVWEGIKARCFNANSKYYYNYGGRGITVCDDWCDSSKFIEWALNSGYKEGLTIDRTDNNGNYCPENCKWVNRKTQSRNTRQNVIIEYMNVKRCKTDWCERLGISVKAIDHCVSRYKLSYQEAFDRYTKKYFNVKLQKWVDK